jgi:hypothetical protein
VTRKIAYELGHSNSIAYCAIKWIDALQGHGFGCDGCGAFFRQRATTGCSMHPHEHAQRTSLPAGLLCKQGLLRYVSRTDWPIGSAAGEIDF